MRADVDSWLVTRRIDSIIRPNRKGKYARNTEFTDHDVVHVLFGSLLARFGIRYQRRCESCIMQSDSNEVSKNDYLGSLDVGHFCQFA